MARTIIDLPLSQLRDLGPLCASLGISRAEAVRRAVQAFLLKTFGGRFPVLRVVGQRLERRPRRAQNGRPAMSAVFDTSLLVDHLRGIKQANAVFVEFPHRLITVTSWIEAMAAAPERLAAQTRDFLRGFERLAINEAIADRALALMQRHAEIGIRHALPWATAQVNTLVYVTANFPKLATRDPSVLIPYKGARKGSRTGRALAETGELQGRNPSFFRGELRLTTRPARRYCRRRRRNSYDLRQFSSAPRVKTGGRG